MFSRTCDVCKAASLPNPKILASLFPYPLWEWHLFHHQWCHPCRRWPSDVPTHSIQWSRLHRYHHGARDPPNCYGGRSGRCLRRRASQRGRGLCDAVKAYVNSFDDLSIVVLKHFAVNTMLLLGAIEALVITVNVYSPEVLMTGVCYCGSISWNLPFRGRRRTARHQALVPSI